MKKRSKKIDTVVQKIKYDSKQLKLRMLGFANKKNYVDYGCYWRGSQAES